MISSTDCCSAAFRICPRNLVADILGGATSLTPSVCRASGTQRMARNIRTSCIEQYMKHPKCDSSAFKSNITTFFFFLPSSWEKTLERNVAARFLPFSLTLTAHHELSDRNHTDWRHFTRSNRHCSTTVKPPVVKNTSFFFNTSSKQSLPFFFLALTSDS